MISLQLQAHGFLLPVRVTPKGGKDCVLPFEAGDTWLKLKVSAPPEDGKANRAVIAYLSGCLGLPKSKITLLSGETARQKRFEIQTPAVQQALGLLAEAMASSPEHCFQLLS